METTTTAPNLELISSRLALVEPDYTAFLVISWDSPVEHFVTEHESVNAVSVWSYKGFERRFRMPENVDAVAARELLDSEYVQKLIHEVRKGYQGINPSTGCAGFSYPAIEAIGILDAIFNPENETLALPDGWGVVDGESWIAQVRDGDLGVSVDSTGAELWTLAEKLDAEALAEGVKLIGAVDALRNRRDRLLRSTVKMSFDSRDG